MRDGECSIRSIDFDADATEDWLFDYDFVPGAELSWMLCEVGPGPVGPIWMLAPHPKAAPGGRRLDARRK